MNNKIFKLFLLLAFCAGLTSFNAEVSIAQDYYDLKNHPVTIQLMADVNKYEQYMKSGYAKLNREDLNGALNDFIQAKELAIKINIPEENLVGIAESAIQKTKKAIEEKKASAELQRKFKENFLKYVEIKSSQGESAKDAMDILKAMPYSAF
ncbi:MAG: hypothetical protein AB1782_12550 [Cyanobacteriota bacterium]